MFAILVSINIQVWRINIIHNMKHLFSFIGIFAFGIILNSCTTQDTDDFDNTTTGKINKKENAKIGIIEKQFHFCVSYDKSIPVPYDKFVMFEEITLKSVVEPFLRYSQVLYDYQTQISGTNNWDLYWPARFDGAFENIQGEFWDMQISYTIEPFLHKGDYKITLYYYNDEYDKYPVKLESRISKNVEYGDYYVFNTELTCNYNGQEDYYLLLKVEPA